VVVEVHELRLKEHKQDVILDFHFKVFDETQAAGDERR